MAAIGTGQVSSAKARRFDLRIRPNRALLAHYPNYLGRVHDVAGMVQVVRVADAVLRAG